MTESIPGVFADSAVAPLSINGTPLSAINEALALNDSILGSQRVANDNRFWASAPRMHTDRVREVYTVSLNTAQQINFISVELARFPQRVWVQYQDPADGQWKPVQDEHTLAPLRMEISDSLPARLTQIADRQKKIHPQHYGAGHWVLFRQTFRTVFAAAYRLVMARIDGAVPRDRSNQPVAYSLGVRNCYVGLDAVEVSQIPRKPFVSDTERAVFANGVDALRSNLGFAVRQNRAESVQFGGVWKSEPQPVPNAVVNFYVDSRDDNGDMQTVDRFFIEPLFTGPKINLYYATDVVPDPTMVGRDDPIRSAQIRASASAALTGTGISLPANDGFLSIDNAGIRFDLRSPWWFGITINPAFASATETTDRYVLAVGCDRRINGVQSTVPDVLSLRWSATDKRWVLHYNGEETTLVGDFSANQSVSLVASFDGSRIMLADQVMLSTDLDGNVVGTPPTIGAQPWDGLIPARLVIGTRSSETSSDTGDFRLTNLVIKNGTPTLPSMVSYMADPEAYVVDQPYPYLDDDSTRGALLRFSNRYKNFDPVKGTGFLGFVGGALIDWDATVWTPVNRDFESRRGFLSFNPVRAAAFKFEFYDLAAQNYDSQTVVNRTVRLFPANPPSPARNLHSEPATSGGGTGVAVAIDQALPTNRFDDAGLVASARESKPQQAYSPTEAIYAEDPVIANLIRSQGRSLDYMRWHSSPYRFCFTGVQRHRYRMTEIRHDHRIAFFAGLKRLEMFRVDYTADDDTDQYLEVFHDSTYFEPDPAYTPLNFYPGRGLTTDSLSGLTLMAMRSKRFSSRRKIRALQFATTQSDPIQMLSNPDFDDTSLAGWAKVGDASIAPTDIYRSTIGTMVEIRRGSRSNTWAAIESLYPSWSDLPADLWQKSVSIPVSSGGITSTEYHLPTAVGRVYAAARVFSPVALTEALVLQILAQDGTVLAESDIDVLPGAVTEWYVGYTIGEGGGTTGRSWADVMAAYPLWSDTAGLRWEEVSQSVQSYTGPVTARVIQRHGSSDVFYADNISLFDDPIQWEFSNDGGETYYPVFNIRNNPRGVFVFPDEGSDLRWRVKIAKPDAWVSAIDVRPQYAEAAMGIPYREGVERNDGNVAHWDHYNPILVDPRFRMWQKPIPEWWWFVNRQWMMRQTPVPVGPFSALPEIIVPDEGTGPITPDGFVLGDALIFNPPPDVPAG